MKKEGEFIGKEELIATFNRKIKKYQKELDAHRNFSNNENPL